MAHQLRHSSAVYGLFGTVLGLMWWLYLGAQLALLASELNVVRARRLWPRSLIQPPLTPTDVEVLDALAEQEHRRPEQKVHSRFRTPSADPDPDPDPAANDRHHIGQDRGSRRNPRP